MKRNRSLLAHAVIASIAVTGLAIANQDGADGSHGDHNGAGAPADIGAFKMILGDKKMDDPNAMAEWMALGQPGEPHKFLAKFNGEWKTTMRMSMDPSQPPTESFGRAWFEPVLGGRFIQHKLATPMMGMPYEGLGFLGFDNTTRMFTQSWMNSMSTDVLMSKGSINREGNQITMFGEMNEPGTGEVGKVVKFLYRFDNDDKFTFEVWEVMYGDPWKVFEIEYNRKK